MSTIYRSAITIALACSIGSADLYAQQLYQPASIMPWVSPSERSDIFAYVATKTPDAPKLLLSFPFNHPDEIPAEVASKKPIQTLPRVETESYALLGQIRLDKVAPGNEEPSPGASVRDSSIHSPGNYWPGAVFRANREREASRRSQR